MSVMPSKQKNRFQPDNDFTTILVYCLLFFTGSLFLYKIFYHFSYTLELLGDVLHLFTPFIAGLLIAFVFFPITSWFYNHLFLRRLHMHSRKAAKRLAILLTYLLAAFLLLLALYFILPQIYRSIRHLIHKLPSWYDSLQNLLTQLRGEHPDWTFLQSDALSQGTIMNALTERLQDLQAWLFPLVFRTTRTIAKLAVSFLIAVISSVCMIADRKPLLHQGKCFLYAVFPAGFTDALRQIGHASATIFFDFIVGKLLDSLIISALCFLFMSLFHLHFIILICAIVFLTNMIPYFGTYMGAIGGCLLLIIDSPMESLIFLIIIMLIKEFNGLYLGPKILGDKTGLSPLWVIIACTVGGNTFGILGMFLGVPVFAVFACILDMLIDYLLRRRHVKTIP